MAKSQRKSHTREFKLEVVEFLKKNGNVSLTARKFGVANKKVREWRASEKQIQEQSRGCRASGRGRTAFFPLMEERLHKEFLDLRREGKKVRRWWFESRGKQLMKEHYPTANEFQFSDHWFRRFRLRYKISLRAETHVSQKCPSSLESVICKFHNELHDVRKDGVFALGDISNMDQTPLPFVLNDGKTYDVTGANEVWCASAASGLDKRQCTVQLTAFADGISRVRPLVIFRGQGKRISKKESDAWDSRVKVMFQPNAWCDEEIMKAWIESEWNNVFTNKPTPGSTGKILVLDMHRAQQTDVVKALLKKHKTTLVSIPGGCTSRIQPLDVSLNKPFKSAVRAQVDKHMFDNLQLYTDGGISASDRRILMTKWIATAWQEVCGKKDMIVRSFKKCGLSLNLDGSEDEQLSVEGLPDYKYRVAAVEEGDASQDDAAAEYDIAEEGDLEFCALADEGDDVEDATSTDAAGDAPVEGGPQSLDTSTGSAPAEEQDDEDERPVIVLD